MSDDHDLEIADIRTIKIKIFDSTVRTIKEIRHMKNLKKNLSYLRQIDSLGFKTQVEDIIMKIIKDVLVVMKVEKITSNLFILKEKTLQKTNAYVISISKGKKLMII